MMERVHQAAAEIFDAAIDLGGTISGGTASGWSNSPTSPASYLRRFWI